MKAPERKPLKLPVVGDFMRMHGELVEIQDVTPPPVKRELDYIFKEQSAQVVARVNGIDIKEFATFNDYYGKGTCVESAIKEAKELQGAFGNAPDLEFVVVLKTELVRMRPVGQQNEYAKEYFDFAALDWGCRRDLPEDTEEVVWSSKQPINTDSPA